MGGKFAGGGIGAGGLKLGGESEAIECRSWGSVESLEHWDGAFAAMI